MLHTMASNLKGHSRFTNGSGPLETKKIGRGVFEFEDSKQHVETQALFWNCLSAEEELLSCIRMAISPADSAHEDTCGKMKSGAPALRNSTIGQRTSRHPAARATRIDRITFWPLRPQGSFRV